MSYEKNIRKDLATLINRREPNLDVVEVTMWEETSYDIGYCNTCSYVVAALNVYYKNSNGDAGKYLYRGDFAELIYELDRLGD